MSTAGKIVAKPSGDPELDFERRIQIMNLILLFASDEGQGEFPLPWEALLLDLVLAVEEYVGEASSARCACDYVFKYRGDWPKIVCWGMACLKTPRVKEKLGEEFAHDLHELLVLSEEIGERREHSWHSRVESFWRRLPGLTYNRYWFPLTEPHLEKIRTETVPQFQKSRNEILKHSEAIGKLLRMYLNRDVMWGRGNRS
jgi:hypothetical protein